MPPRCTICTHKQREEIEAAILREEPYRDIALQFDTSHTSIMRHRNGCMREMVEAGRAAGIIESATEIQKRIKTCADDLKVLFDEAKSKEKYGPAVSAKRAELEALKMLVPAQGEGGNRPDDGLISALRNVAEVLDWTEEEPL